MNQYTHEEIEYLKHFLRTADEHTLFELFGNNWETVKAIIDKEKPKEPYEFHNRFGDLN